MRVVYPLSTSALYNFLSPSQTPRQVIPRGVAFIIFSNWQGRNGCHKGERTFCLAPSPVGQLQVLLYPWGICVSVQYCSLAAMLAARNRRGAGNRQVSGRQSAQKVGWMRCSFLIEPFRTLARKGRSQ